MIVLGGITTSIDGSVTDLDDVMNAGNYFWDNNGSIPSHHPDNTASSFYLSVKKGNTGSRTYQVFVKEGDQTTYSRAKAYNGTWGNWIRQDNFGCNTLSDLASALGVSQKYYIGSSEWLSITVNNTFSGVYLLGFDPSLEASENKIIITKDYDGTMHINGTQGKLLIKTKGSSYYISIPGGYTAILSEVAKTGCTIEYVFTIPSDAIDVTI